MLSLELPLRTTIKIIFHRKQNKTNIFCHQCMINYLRALQVTLGCILTKLFICWRQHYFTIIKWIWNIICFWSICTLINVGGAGQLLWRVLSKCKRVKNTILYISSCPLWLFKQSGGYFTLSERFHPRTGVKNHSKRCKLQSKRVEDYSKKSCPSLWLFKEYLFTLLHLEGGA